MGFLVPKLFGDADLSSGATETSANQFVAESDLSRGTHTFYLQERDEAGNWSASGSFSTEIGWVPLVAVNSGSFSGVGRFVSSRFSTTSNMHSENSTIDLSALVDPPPMEVFRSHVWGPDTITVPTVALRPHKVRLYFADNYFSAPGERVFDVSINGTKVLDDFDIIAVAGARDKAVARDFEVDSSSVGEIIITLESGAADNPLLSGFEVLHEPQAPVVATRVAMGARASIPRRGSP